MNNTYRLIFTFVLFYFGCHWVYDQIKNKNLNSLFSQDRKSKRIIPLAVALSLFMQPVGLFIGNSRLVENNQQLVEAATLADINILTDTDITVELGNVNGQGPYELKLRLTGRGLADVELVNPETVAVFYLPDLADDLGEEAIADVRVEILPITMEDLPALRDIISDLTSTLTGIVENIVGLVEDIIWLIPNFLLEIDASALHDAIAPLNNLDDALEDLLDYSEKVEAHVNDNGIITIDFSDGIDNHINTLIQEIILDLLDNVINAVDEITVTVIGLPVGRILNIITEDILQPVLDPVKNLLHNNIIELTGDLVAAQVIGRTTVELSIPVSKSKNALGEVPVKGTIINTAEIDMNVLSTLNDVGTISFPEPPEVPILNDVYQTDKVVTGSGEANTTVTIIINNQEFTGEVNDEGNFSVNIQSLEHKLITGTIITAYLTDEGYRESERATTKVIEEIITFHHVPETISFQTTEITGETVTIPREVPSWTIQIIDTRRQNNDLKLTAKTSGPLTSNEGDHELPEALVFVNDKGVSQPLSHTDAIEVYNGETEGLITDVNWEADKGPLIKVNTSNVRPTDYSTTITWTLENVPGE